MNTPIFLVRARGLMLSILGFALALAVIPAPARSDTRTADNATLADKAPALPLKATFEKDTTGTNEAPMILRLKNESSQSITVSGEIELSVVVHNRPKSRSVPAQAVAAGATLTIDNLAPEDKVTLKAEGFAPLVVAVPYKP